MQTNILIYHEDRYLLDSISTYISSNNREFNLLIYTEGEKALEYIRENSTKIDVIISTHKFLKSISSVNITKIAISNNTIFEAQDDLFYLNVYQSGEDIVNDLKKICLIENNMPITNKKSQSTKLVSFYSTQGGSGKTTISYSTAVQCATNSKVLYLNFETSSYTDNLYKENSSVPMEDILFAIKDKRRSMEIILKGAVKNRHNVYVLPPFSSLGDLLDLTVEDIKNLLNSIIKTGEYEYIFIDLSSEFTPMNHVIMEECHKIILVYSGDTIGNGKLNLFLNDPYISRLPVFNNFRVVRNKCLQKKQYDHCIAIFPFSQSMAKDVEITTILSNNPEFANACRGILQILN